MTVAHLTTPNTFCANSACPDYAQPANGNLRRYGKTRAGVQRYQCTTCGVTFTATRGTLFYGCHTPPELILDCLALLADRASLAAIHRIKGVKEETVSAWLMKAAEHVEALEALLLSRHSVSRAQLDALWTFVGHKGEKGGTPRSRSEAPSGAAVPSTAITACGSGARSPKRKPRSLAN